MKKLLFIFLALVSVAVANAQEKKKPGGFMNRTGDHLMLQLTSDYWSGTPDSIDSRINGFARGANVYVMLDKRFKGSPQWSVAFGVGVGTSNMYFRNMVVDIKSQTNTLPFLNVDSINHFKKYKLTTAFLEIPVELRFTLHPERESKSIKAALGFKVGTVLSVHTKGKNLEDKNGNLLSSYKQKETEKGYFNSTRMAATFRVGYGNFSLFGSYQINNILKDGVGPDLKLIQVGLNFSGL
ncbi:MAG: outer membrane beta-barrel protein [Chitinophagaceae bacterium]|nr:outer membrane beta-barrel protein [Chitinophagaceae bacterium]